MERALLQGEREAEVVRLRQEQEAVQQLQEKLSSLDASIRKERDKVTPVTGPHCHQLCHALPGTHSQCCNASRCSIPLRTCSPDPGLCRGFGEQPLWFAWWGDLSPWAWSNSPAGGEHGQCSGGISAAACCSGRETVV